MKLLNFSVIAILTAVGMCFIGCTPRIERKPIQPNEVFKQMQEDFKRMQDPHSSVEMMRKYAQEKLPDATDEELKFLMGEPVVKSNYDGTMYVFFWKRAYGKGIQVISTPPPCRPMTVSRVRRPTFP